MLNTFAGAKTVTVKGGVNPPGFRSGLGDLVLSAIQSAQRQYIFIESARHVQADGSINIDYEAAMTGTVWVFRIPPDFL